MNFYTLTFKKKVAWALFSILIIIVMFDIALSIYVDLKTTKNNYLGKFSKIKHFELNNIQKKDIIFIGSSRTYYSISTNIFKDNGINIYNFGISGAQFEDYPAIVNSAIQSKPKKIVISIPVDKLYSKLLVSKLPTIYEMKFYLQIDKFLFFKSIEQWIINKHTFLEYSEPIYQRILKFYTKFKPKLKTKDNIQTQLLINYDKIADCKVVDVKNKNEQHTRLKCSNGDGILVGNYIQPEDKKQSLLNLNENSINYLKKLIDLIKKNNMELVLIFEPRFHNPYTYDISKIKRELKNINIMDLTNFDLNDFMWADNGHLNYEGRKLYTKYLIKQLRERNEN